MKVWKYTYYTLSIIPWPFIIGLLMFYFHAWYILGHAPTYNYFELRKLSMIDGYYVAIIVLSMCAYTASFCFWFLLSIFYILLLKKEIEWKLLVSSAVGQLLALYLLISDIGGWFSWVLDWLFQNRLLPQKSYNIEAYSSYPIKFSDFRYYWWIL